MPKVPFLKDSGCCPKTLDYTLSMQGQTATTRHGVTRKRSTKKLKHTENLLRKNLKGVS